MGNYAQCQVSAVCNMYSKERKASITQKLKYIHKLYITLYIKLSNGPFYEV